MKRNSGDYEASLVTQVFGLDLYRRVKALVANQTRYKAVWFSTLTLYPSRGLKSDREHAVRAFNRYMVEIANQTNSHLIPIASIGKTKAGWYHFHFVLVMERGKQRPTYRQMKRWWKHGKRNEWKLFNTNTTSQLASPSAPSGRSACRLV